MPNKVGLSTPWVTYARKVNALFEEDPEVLVDYENDGPTLILYVENAAKADALEQLLPATTAQRQNLHSKAFSDYLLKCALNLREKFCIKRHRPNK